MHRIPGHRLGKVSNLASVPREAFIRPPIHHEPAAETGAEEEIEERGQLLPRSIPVLANRSGGRVVLQEDGQPEPLPSPAGEWDVVPSGECGRVDDVLVAVVPMVHGSGNAD